MDSLTVCEIISIPGGIVILEGQITLFISYFIISELDQDIFESQLCVVKSGIHMGLSVFKTIEQPVLFIILKIGFGDRITFGHIQFLNCDGIAVVIQGIGA